MGRAGSGGGGGHSSGGHSSSHSSGGHHVSSHRSSSSGGRAGSSFSHSSSHHSSFSHSGSTFSHGHSYGPTYSHHGYGAPPPPPGYGRPPGSVRVYNNYGGGSSGSALTSVAIIIIIVAVFLVIALSGKAVGRSDIPKSTHNREKITDAPAFYDDCVVDELGWFDNVNSAGSKLRSFYDKTGIQPYVYLHEYDSSLWSDADKDAWANELFTQLDLSEETFLYVYFAEANQDEDVGYMVYVQGKRTEAIMDNEAVDVFWAYIDKYWYVSEDELSTDDLFAKVFDETADRIMTRTKTGIDILYVGIIAIIIIGAFISVIVIMVLKRKHEAERAAETERILNAPMQDLTGGSQSDPLVQQYMNSGNQNNQNNGMM